MLPRQFKWCIVTNCCGGHQAAETCQNNDTLMMLNYSCPSLLWGQNLIALQWRGPQTIRPTDKIERDHLSFFPPKIYCVWMDWSWSKSDFNSRRIASQATPCNHVSMTRKLNMVLMIQLTTRWQTSRWSGAQGEIHSKCMRRLQGDITAGAAALKSWQSLLQAEPARRRDQ